MKVRIIGDEIWAGEDKIGSLDPNFPHATLMEAFKHDFNRRFEHGLRIYR